ncbi:MAG TPA: NADH-quinone oxidoreductase subunit N, partial [Vicinamibacteria bacterium]|nr:NADH-quinone oxidoreductase subunit N [Vicinamibacteria bacterium]
PMTVQTAVGVLDLRPVIPALIVTLTGVFVLLIQAFTPRGRRAPSALWSLFGLAAALVATIALALRGRGAILGGSVVADDFALFFHVLILGIAMVAVLISPAYLRATGGDRGEYYALLLFSVVGMLGLVSCLELVSLFVALEVMSVSLYAMCGLHRDRMESQESAVKYFITGAFSSAFFLYGVALLYGASGSTHLLRIATAASGPNAGLALIGVGFLLVGFGFKIASVPFHQWAPDVYEGAPTTVTALMSAGVKAAAFGALLRVFWKALPALAAEWQPAVAVLAIVSMVIGNLAALSQTNVKRMLAYSSIAHAGYLLTALVAAPTVGAQAILFYLVAYATVNLGGFGAMAALARGDREPLGLNDFAGLSERRPLLAAAVAVYMVSLTGIPVSAGFVGKFYLFNAAVGAGYTNLAIVGMITSVISAYYYLRVIVYMYMREPVGEDTWSPVRPGSAIALAVAAVIILGLGIWPTPVLGWAHAAALALR